LSGDAFRALVVQATERIVAHLATLPTCPAVGPVPGAQVMQRLREPLPEAPAAFGELLDQVFDDLLPAGIETAGPGYLAYMPSGGLLHAAVADLIAAAVNRYVGVWASSPGLAELEATVVRWFADLMGFPPAARGYLASGGSMANFSAVLCARGARLAGDVHGAAAYASDLVHHSMTKALAMAGFAPQALVTLASPDSRLSPQALRERIRADRRAGRRPFLVVANAGATLTGTVDDLAALADVARDEGVWLHVDAAYGGFFQLTQRGRALLAGVDRADSVTLDPHKTLFLPYGTGALLVRDGAALHEAHRSHGERYSPRQDDGGRIDFCEHSPELSRELRGLRVWLPLRMHGAGPFRDALDEKLDLAQWAAAQLAALPEVELVGATALSVVVFRWNKPGLEAAALDALNRRWLEAINARRRVLLMGVVLRGRFVLRLCVLSLRTHRQTMEFAMEDIRAAMAQLLAPPAVAPPP
jgi:aromatic-L-amino-acid decarboxylase